MATDTGPEVVSLQLHVAVTLVLFQPAGFAAVRPVKLMRGAVLSIFMPLAVAGELTLPALSVQPPLADCPEPSPDRTIGAEHESRPERLSLPVMVTVTLLLFQPFAFGAGKAPAVAVGGVL